MTALQPRRHPDAHQLPAPQATFGDYMSLVKPRIIELLLVTTFPVMFLAQRGVPAPGLIVATLVGEPCPRRVPTSSTATWIVISTD